MKLTYDYLRQNYYTNNGKLFWRGGLVEVGTKSEHNGKTYLRCNIKGEMHYVHRLIFWLAKGYLPPLVDHEDKDTLNNDPNNLRDLNHNLNLLNAKIRTDNSSGVTGVRWHKAAGKWVARLGYKGRNYHLGLFENFDDAVEARRNKNTTLFSELET